MVDYRIMLIMQAVEFLLKAYAAPVKPQYHLHDTDVGKRRDNPLEVDPDGEAECFLEQMLSDEAFMVRFSSIVNYIQMLVSDENSDVRQDIVTALRTAVRNRMAEAHETFLVNLRRIK